MGKASKRVKAMEGKVDPQKVYSLEEAIKILKGVAHPKFDESVDVAMNLNVDLKDSQQNVRGTVVLPHGTGKTVRVLVFCKGEFETAAKQSGADHYGSDELISKVAGGFLDFDVVVATPDMMKDIAKLGKVLGPRGLMPNPKLGTVTNDVARAVKELKAGKVEYKMDKLGNIHTSVGKLSFDEKKIKENAEALINAVSNSKPAGVKGIFVKKTYITTTMGPGIKIQF